MGLNNILENNNYLKIDEIQITNAKGKGSRLAFRYIIFKWFLIVDDKFNDEVKYLYGNTVMMNNYYCYDDSVVKDFITSPNIMEKAYDILKNKVLVNTGISGDDVLDDKPNVIIYNNDQSTLFYDIVYSNLDKDNIMEILEEEFFSKYPECKVE